MEANQWLRVAALASVVAIAGPVLADDQKPAGTQDQAGANANTAAQLGTDTPTTQPGDGSSTSSAVDTSKQTAKHPPTNRMDQATPSEKSPRDRPAAKHPPTARMDAATPDEKSPKTSQ